jgi:hypothetical protein
MKKYEKTEWAVFVKGKDEWEQYGFWDENLERSKKIFSNAKARNYNEIKLMRKVTLENISMDYRERNGHFIDGVYKNIGDLK